MALMSPQVQVKETDLSNTIPAIATSIAGYAGKFDWGPCYVRVNTNSERSLTSNFGTLTDGNYEDWLSVWNFLQYGNNLNIVRVVDQDSAKNAGAAFDSEGGSQANDTQAIRRMNDDDETETIVWGANENLRIVARYPSTTDDIYVSIANWKNFYSQVPYTTASGTFVDGETVDIKRVDVVVGSALVQKADNTGSIIYLDNIDWTISENTAIAATDQIVGLTSGATADDIGTVIDENDVVAYTANGSVVEFVNLVDRAPEEREVAIVVFKGTSVVETFIAGLDADARDYEGNNIYIEELINRGSSYIRAYQNESEVDEIPENGSYIQLKGGKVSSDNTNAAITDGMVITGYDMFANPEEVDINLIFDGANCNQTVQLALISMAESRKDCVAILGVPKSTVVGVSTPEVANANVVSYRKFKLQSSSYAALYNNWKYQYDKVNDKYRWVPISGDVAGIFANTDLVADPWYAPAGFNRGQMKNVVKYAYNPNQAQRDNLYKEGINPVVYFPGDGPVVFGQKTLQVKASAFDRVDVRRLFIVLEKAIATASKYFMFEKNSAFTRRRVQGMIDPFLRDVKGREGVYDFRVICDGTNNTGEVIDRNEMIIDIYIQPSKSAEFIVLNFYATKTGVNFDEFISQG